MSYDPYNAREPETPSPDADQSAPPKAAARGRKKPAAPKAGKREPTVRITTSDGKSTGDVPMSVVKAALKVVKGKRDSETAEAFSPEETGEAATRTVAAGQLRAFIERIERLEEDKATIAEDIKEVKSEAKGVGFDLGAINALVKLRKMDQAERQEADAILDLYKAALGMA